jgi:glycosyltransferase involved in cell wall biosynthesis
VKIVFVASSLESGRDGVGDYTRSLAAECTQLGHEVGLLGLHDRHVQAPVTEEQPATVRLPATMPWAERLPQARAFCTGLDPQWISLQFVPYGFHDKGFAWKVADYLRPIVTKRGVHVMFHELWIGGYRRAKLKERVIGTLQRACIFHMLRSVGPSAISTSNAPYIGMLKGGGFDAELLPMFGSIPFAESADVEWVYDEIRRAGVPSVRRDELWLFCVFGSLHSIWPSEPLVQYLREAGERNGRKIVVISIGRLGPGEPLWDRLKSQYRDVLHFVRLGERSTREVSAALQASDFGLATSPWELIGKSSSVASMLEHGLPVIVNRDEVRFGSVTGTEMKDPLLVKMDAQLPARISGLRKRPPQAGVPAVAREFLRLLEHTANPTA